MQDKRHPWYESYPQGVPAVIDPHLFENLNDLFDYATLQYAKRTAFINMKGSITFEDLSREAEAFAAFLQHEWGLKKGDRLAVMMPNLIQYPIVLFGALKAGLIVVNTNPLYTATELLGQLRDSRAKAIVVIANYAFNLQKIIAKTSIEHVVVTNVGDGFGFFRGKVVNFAVRFIRKMVPSFLIGGSVSYRRAVKTGAKYSFEEVKVAYDDIAFLQYTGGTTGKPKGAMLSHGNIIANISQGLGMYSNVLKRGEEFLLTAIPLYHVFAMTVNLMLFAAIGGTNLLITDPRRLKDLIADLKAHPEITIITGVNTLFNRMLNHPDFETVNLSNLKLVIGGGAAVQSGVDARFYQRTGLHILEGYGLTECSPLCCVNPSNIDKFTGSIGIPVPSTEARIIGDDGNEIWDVNVPGELEFKGPQVMKGYFNNEEGTRLVMHDGYVRTGDIAVWLDKGYIKIIDRLKDMILVSGFNVFPAEIEDVISRFDRVTECAAIGVPSPETGEAVKLFVVKKDSSLTKDEIVDYCRQYLAPYKIPKIIEFVDVLPKSAIGKVLRRYLKDGNKAHRNDEN